MAREKLFETEKTDKPAPKLTKNKLLRLWAAAVDAYIADDLFQHYAKDLFGDLSVEQLKQIVYTTIKSPTPARTINELCQLSAEQVEYKIPRPKRKETRRDVMLHEMHDLGFDTLEAMVKMNRGLVLRDPQTGKEFLAREEVEKAINAGD